MRNLAIAIGINKYGHHLQELDYAENDAHQFRDFLLKEAGFEKVWYFADDSPDVAGESTKPIRSNIITVLEKLSKNKPLAGVTNLWFFFAGHGIVDKGNDYLFMADSNPDLPDQTAIPTNLILQKLKLSGVENVVMFLDACRNVGRRSGEGIGRVTTAEVEKIADTVCFFACSPSEFSRELKEYQHGVFTYALLEGLGIQGRKATVEKLDHFLGQRVPELAKANQHPRVVKDTGNKHLILMPKYAEKNDLEPLKKAAYRAHRDRNLTEARRLWLGILAIDGTDYEAIREIEGLAVEHDRLTRQIESAISAISAHPIIAIPETRNPEPPAIPQRLAEEQTKGQEFSFEIIKVNAQGQEVSREPGKAYQKVFELSKGINLEMIYIPGGTFQMGSADNERDSDERPQHEVKIQPFYLSKYPITQEQYQAVVGSNPASFKGAKRPVEQVSWDNAVDFCQKISQDGRKYRLPSEAEWEYACRAGTTTPFYFGETITPDLVNYDGNNPYGKAPKGLYREETTDVGSFPPNAFGLYDMHGNVWEWCSDRWHENYNGAPTDGSSWETGTVDKRVQRGGSWGNNAVNCRCVNRFGDSAGGYDGNVGFRVALGFPLPSLSVALPS